MDIFKVNLIDSNSIQTPTNSIILIDRYSTLNSNISESVLVYNRKGKWYSDDMGFETLNNYKTNVFIKIAKDFIDNRGSNVKASYWLSKDGDFDKYIH